MAIPKLILGCKSEAPAHQRPRPAATISVAPALLPAPEIYVLSVNRSSWIYNTDNGINGVIPCVWPGW
tara:strand:- start:22377 stop:22580 length:204 start_codon:yes stop_codon:yes gene_type:complete